MPIATRSGVNTGDKASSKGPPQKRGQQQKQKTGPTGRAPQQQRGIGEQYAPSQVLIIHFSSYLVVQNQ
jgi:hypothetical protein